MFRRETGATVVSQYFVGVDLGQGKEPTAIAVVERAELVGEWDAVAWANRKEMELRLRRLDRLPLGMKYPEMEQYVMGLVGSVAKWGDCELVVDATGAGRPAVDHLHMDGPGRRMRAVMVTGGQMERSEGGIEYLPRRDLITGLRMVFEYGELKIATTLRHVDALKKEMADMRMKATPAGNEQFGVWREGEHDDLVLAVALACWGARKRYPEKPRGADAYWTGRMW